MFMILSFTQIMALWDEKVAFVKDYHWGWEIGELMNSSLGGAAAKEGTSQS